MKLLPFVPAAVLSMMLSAGCGHVGVVEPGGADRVLTGVVAYASGDPLPEGAEVMVRVVDLGRGDAHGEVLGEQTIKGPVTPPIPFRIEYRAEDAVLMRRVNVEARISVGGRLRYTTTTGHPVTLGNFADAHTVEVEFLGRR
jgi:uncharacterized lipoprotein YbaY